MKPINETKLAALIGAGPEFTTNEALRAAGWSDNQKSRASIMRILEARGLTFRRKGNGRRWYNPHQPKVTAAAAANEPAPILTAADFDRIREIAAELVNGPAPTVGNNQDNVQQSIYSVTDVDELHAYIRRGELENSNLQEQRRILGDNFRKFVDRWVGALVSAGLVPANAAAAIARKKLEDVDVQLNASWRKYEALREAPINEVDGGQQAARQRGPNIA